MVICEHPHAAHDLQQDRCRQVDNCDHTRGSAEDAWLNALYSDQMSRLRDYLRFSPKLKAIIGPHEVILLESGVSVALDFPANTVEQRNWMRGILDKVQVEHMVHVLNPPDEVCRARRGT